MTNLDFNTAGIQRDIDVIPARTICTLQMSVRPGGGSDGWLKPSKDGNSEALDCEFVVVDGPYAKRKLWQLFTLTGNTSGHTTAGDISRKTLRAILESARAIKPDDNNEQIPASDRKAYQAPTNGSGATPTANPATPTTSAPPAGGTIDRPNWAK